MSDDTRRSARPPEATPGAADSSGGGSRRSDAGMGWERRLDPARVAGSSDFLALMRQRERGRLKVYIGSAAGTGKTFRMLQEAHDLKRRDVDVVVGYVETHNRAETEAQIRDLEVVPRKKIEYRGVTLEEMDVDAVVARRPQVAIVDELAHTNVPGARNGKRWQDVLHLLDEGINVITAVNVQHLESLNDVLERELGVTIRETVPDWVVGQADQVVNLDISAEDLRQRLKEGKIYHPDKIQTALANFFTDENLTTLRELALREVASSVDRSREEIVRRQENGGTTARRTVDRVMACLSSDPPLSRVLLRKASRIAGRLNSDWFCVYVQLPEERADRIDSTIQRHLVDNIQLAQSLGAEVVKLDGSDVAETLIRFAAERGVTLAIVGETRRSRWYRLRRGSIVDRLMAGHTGLDVLVVSGADEAELRSEKRERRVEIGSDE
ncbi:MAG TPA: universal stress protein [Gemmatimonadaceae bacterium]|jgi:two-component system sensor histidine kinase KdpD